MEDNQPAVVVKDLYKTFMLPHEQLSGIKQAAVQLFNRKRGFEKQKVLTDISFQIEKGDFFGIVGRNGSGKSTLLKLLANIYTPDKGLIQINGSLIPFIELGVGFNPELTGRENVYLNGALLGFSQQEMDSMYDEIVEFAEIERFMDQKLKNYSSGMQVRLAFSIAIRAKSDILVLDEVLAVGDEAFQKKCNVFFNNIKKDKSKTVILVTHSMESVRRYCNKALMLEKGKIVAFGDPEEVADDYSKQFIDNTTTSIKEKNRQGTGEVIYQNIKHELTDKWFTLDFDIKNKTSKKLDGITMGFDFCVDDDPLVGNDTRYLDKYKSGITLEANKKKHFTIQFPNNFSGQTYSLIMNITTELGMNITDYIRPAISFDANNVKYGNAFKLLLNPKITEGESE